MSTKPRSLAAAKGPSPSRTGRPSPRRRLDGSTARLRRLTNLANLVLLCGRHHRFLHEGAYSLEVLADGGAVFRDPWGGPIPNVPRPPPGNSHGLLEGNRSFAIDASTCKGGDGDRMDLGLAVDALLTAASAKAAGP